jgi:hypothetical protein
MKHPHGQQNHNNLSIFSQKCGYHKTLCACTPITTENTKTNEIEATSNENKFEGK